MQVMLRAKGFQEVGAILAIFFDRKRGGNVFN
jgi:hypothetical protein